jgi:hypothetical protein
MGAPSKVATYDDNKNADIQPNEPPADMPPYPGPYGTDPATGQPRTEPEVTGTQPADTPGNDENADGAKAGQATADQHGDVLGL